MNAIFNVLLDMFDEAKRPFTIFLIVLVLGFSLVYFVKIIDIKYIQNVPTKCWVDGKLIYDGISAGINVLSTGRTTKVDIKGGFLYLFPKEFYVSDDVKLEGFKK